MGLFDFGRNDEMKPSGTTVTGYGGSVHYSSDSAVRSHLSGIGQTTDPITGITGRTAEEVYDKARNSGMNQNQLSELVRRIGR